MVTTRPSPWRSFFAIGLPREHHATGDDMIDQEINEDRYFAVERALNDQRHLPPIAFAGYKIALLVRPISASLAHPSMADGRGGAVKLHSFALPC